VKAAPATPGPGLLARVVGAVAPYRKAVVAFVVPGLVALGAALADGRLTAAEVVGVLVAALGSSGAVYAVPNSSTGPASSSPGSSPGSSSSSTPGSPGVGL
jgi:hypothetical protein